MSKTDKTRPWWVRMRDDRGYIREVHRHEHGPCTLPADLDEDAALWSRDRCYYGVVTAFWYTSGGSCGCQMCTQQYTRRQERRRARHRWATVLRTRDLDALDDFTG